MQDLWIISFFLIFFHKVRHCKVRTWRFPVFEKTFMGSESSKSPKNEVLRFYQKSYSLRCICFFFASSWKCQWSFNFLPKQHVWEKSGLWSINLKANQNAGFFTLEYLENKLKYDEVDFLDVTRGAWKQQILVDCFKWVWRLENFDLVYFLGAYLLWNFWGLVSPREIWYFLAHKL